ncbi:MAG: hypothetical protein QHI38_07490 [Armatimonadota bacterium]|nr:hypothetical protein [Armatimonadota bacterium]
MAFRTRGYYVIPSRNQFWGPNEWRRYIDCTCEDGCNLLIFWIAGSFPSRRYPETWSYNLRHRNIEQNFYPSIIDYAHEKGLRVVLGFTPYAYDGVASFAATHPELAGRNADGSIHRTRGIHDVGMWLCPSHPESRQFMLDYVREMYFEFHPNADGLFIESSDYGHCQCSHCSEQYFGREWEFVNQISNEVWNAKPDATIIIYPVYYQLKLAVPDTRFTLFFTPHSAHITPDVLAVRCEKIYWEGLSFEKLDAAARGAKTAYEHGLDGYVAAMETFGYTQELNGRLVTYEPFDVPWTTADFPMEDLVPRVLRFAYKFYSWNPCATEQEFQNAVALQFFANSDTEAARDLIYLCSVLQESFQHFGRRSALAHPEDFEHQYPPEKRSQALTEYAEILSRLSAISKKYPSHELGRTARWIVERWRASHPRTFQ